MHFVKGSWGGTFLRHNGRRTLSVVLARTSCGVALACPHVTTSAALAAGQVVTVSTAGGTSAPVSVALDDPAGVAGLYDLALFPATAGADAGRFVTVDTNTFALRVLDPTTLATVRTITRPGAATGQLGLSFLGAPVTVGAVVVPAGSLAVVNGGDAPDRLYYLDPTGTGTVLASVALGGQPLVDEAGGFAVAYHAARNSFFVLRHGTDLLTEIDPATGAALRSMHLGIDGQDYFAGLTVHPTRGTLLLGNRVRPAR